MAEQPKAFQHADGGLREQLLNNVVDPNRPFIERFMSGVAVMAARAVLEEANKQGQLLPGTAPAPETLPTSLPQPKPQGG